MSNVAAGVCKPVFYRPNEAASADFIALHGGSPGTKSTGDTAFFENMALGRCTVGGNRAAKSTKLVMEAGSVCVGMRPWYDPQDPWHRRGLKLEEGRWGATPARVRYVVQNFGVHVPEVMKELRKWWPEDWWTVSSRGDSGIPRQITWFNGSDWIFMSHKQDREDFEGIEADLICWDEPPPKDRWVALNRGLVSTGGRWCVGATLLDSAGWFWDEVIIPFDGVVGEDISVSWHSIWDNTKENGGCPTQTCRNVRSWLESIGDPDERMAREHGYPMHIGGIVLSAFTETENLVDPITFPPNTYIVSAIDPAGSKPFAGLHVAYFENAEGKWEGHVFDETLIPQTHNDLGMFCRIWLEKESGKGDVMHPSPSVVTIIDPFAEETQKADAYGRSMIRILAEDYKIETVKAQRMGKKARLMQLNARFRTGNYKIWRTCTRFLAERKRWAWDPGSPKSTKGPDDLCDCLSYIDSIDPPKTILKVIDGEEVGGIWKPEEYREREVRTDAARAREQNRERLRRRGIVVKETLVRRLM